MEFPTVATKIIKLFRLINQQRQILKLKTPMDWIAKLKIM
jgi:hypothetical protein